MVGSPEAGADLFRAKGCARCHAVNGVGGSDGPELGSEAGSESGPDRLVSAMWNHAPAMWERMEAERVGRPRITLEEMSHLFAYLYTIQYIDPPGQAVRGQAQFDAKGCARCHTIAAATTNPGSGQRALSENYTPVAWAQAMWNHPREESTGDVYARFQGSEMADLLAYVRDGARSRGMDPHLASADPDRGWRLFHVKSCTKCHPVREEAGRSGPALASGTRLPPSILQLAGSMWDHPSTNTDESHPHGTERPRVETGEMADLIAFLYSSRYYEPGGAPKIGEVLFSERGCSGCHGSEAQGSGLGPGLRGRGRSFSSVSLAAALWDHGPVMRREAQQRSLPWPILAPRDVGDILAFLNSSSE